MLSARRYGHDRWLSLSLSIYLSLSLSLRAYKNKKGCVFVPLDIFLLGCAPFFSMVLVCRQMGAIGSRTGKSGVSSTGENIPQENFDIPVSGEGEAEGERARVRVASV